MLRDATPTRLGSGELERLAGAIKDHNLRLFAENDRVHLVSAGMHLHDTDPFRLFERLLAVRQQGDPAHEIDPAHAFYLGYEMSKAVTALVLGKDYEQDEPLDWGFLTPPERHHRLDHS
jgi:hypothetical protein